tara:strand:+ start:5234 stop:5785 length:552 start_codon:yes stop_codon:yes gene_type:complete
MNPKLDPHCVPNTFTNEECDKITQIGEDIGVKLSGIDVSSLNPIRKSWNSFIPFDKDVEWIYNRIGDVARDINSRWYHFDAEGFENLQYIRYEDDGCHYNWHVDNDLSDDSPQRKIGFSLQLSNGDEYDGGDLQIHHTELFNDLPRDKGTLIVFPSFCLHRITPVTRGIRKSMVAHLAGRAFR